MMKTRLDTLAISFLILFAATLYGQTELHHSPPTSIVTAQILYRVEVGVNATDQALYVPYCRGSEGPTKYLCTRGTHLQQKLPQGWEPVGLREGNTLGGYGPLQTVPSQVIPVKRAALFFFEFAPEIFELVPGRPLRVIIDVWPSKESLASGKPPIELSSPEFIYPPPNIPRRRKFGE